MQEISFPQWPFESRPKQDKKLLPDWMDWLSYLAGGSKMRFQFLAYQVDKEIIIKWWKDFLLYFTTLETYLVMDGGNNKICF